MFENVTVLKGKRGSLEAAMPRFADAACERLAVRGVVRGLFSFAKKTGADVFCSFSVCERGGFLCVSARAEARVEGKSAQGVYTLVMKDGVPWEPSRELKKDLAQSGAKAAERALRLGEPLYADAAILAKRFFSRAQVVPADGGFEIIYPPRTVAPCARSFFVRGGDKNYA